MEEYDVKVFQNGPINTVHVKDKEGNLHVGVHDNLEEAAGIAVSKAVHAKVKDFEPVKEEKKVDKQGEKALTLLKQFAIDADVDKLFDNANELLKENNEA